MLYNWCNHINENKNCDYLKKKECFSCLFWAIRTKSSNLISSTLRNHVPIDGGVLFFHIRGMQDLAVFNKCCTINFWYLFARIVVAWSRRKAGSSGII